MTRRWLWVVLVVIFIAGCVSPIERGGLSQCGYCPYGPAPRDLTARPIDAYDR